MKMNQGYGLLTKRNIQYVHVTSFYSSKLFQRIKLIGASLNVVFSFTKY